ILDLDHLAFGFEHAGLQARYPSGRAQEFGAVHPVVTCVADELTGVDAEDLTDSDNLVHPYGASAAFGLPDRGLVPAEPVVAHPSREVLLREAVFLADGPDRRTEEFLGAGMAVLR